MNLPDRKTHNITYFSLNQTSKGFTLIELLIVIVIIGILSGILIAVINPVRQQSRAKNGAIRSTISKIAFSLNSARSGLGRLPSETELVSEIDNLAIVSQGGVAGTLSVNVSVAGTTLPELECNGNNRPAATAGNPQDCAFVLVSSGSASYNDLVNGSFRIIAEAFKVDPTVTTAYVFDSTEGMFECNLAGATTNIADVTQLWTINGSTLDFDLPTLTGLAGCVEVN